MITKWSEFLNEDVFNGWSKIPVRPELDYGRNMYCGNYNYAQLVSTILTIGFDAEKGKIGEDLLTKVKQTEPYKTYIANKTITDEDANQIFRMMTTNNNQYKGIIAPILKELLKTDKRVAMYTEHLKEKIKEAEKLDKTKVKDKMFLDFVFMNRDKIFTYKTLLELFDLGLKFFIESKKSEINASKVLKQFGFQIFDLEQFPKISKFDIDAIYGIDIITKTTDSRFKKNSKGYTLFQVKYTKMYELNGQEFKIYGGISMKNLEYVEYLMVLGGYYTFIIDKKLILNHKKDGYITITLAPYTKTNLDKNTILLS